MRDTVIYNVIVNWLSDSWCVMWSLPYARAKYVRTVENGVASIKPN